jgi:hypothetical protein
VPDVSTLPAAVLALAVLAAAGALPAVALAGLRWLAVPLAPLAGAVVAGVGATAFVAAGGAFMAWFVGMGAAGAAAVVGLWWAYPEQRPVPVAGGTGGTRRTWYRAVGAAGAVGTVVACAWSLRALATPTVGFDARALWLLRAGWFLHSHGQMLTDLRLHRLALNQSAYPPLVSASTAVAWSVTGVHTDRLGVVVIALLNSCALLAAAFAVVECGRRVAARVRGGDGDRAPAGPAGWCLPAVVGAVAAVLLVPIAFGVTEPFMTNGYADPLWSLAALGAVAWGLQLDDTRSHQGVTALLLLVAGLSKDEGFATAALLVAVVALRRVAVLPAAERRRRWWPPVVVAVVELAVVLAWPALMRVLHARGVATPLSSPHAMVARARATYDGFVPYLHVLALAGPVAVVGGLVLARVRRIGRVANDWWGWAGLACGLLAVGGALVTGTDDIQAWLVTTVHRVTEFPALAGWWILAVWAVVAAAAPAAVDTAGPVRPGATDRRDAPAAGRDGGPDAPARDRLDPVGAPAAGGGPA